jgi:hypothetical protein
VIFSIFVVFVRRRIAVSGVLQLFSYFLSHAEALQAQRRRYMRMAVIGGF